MPHHWFRNATVQEPSQQVTITADTDSFVVRFITRSNSAAITMIVPKSGLFEEGPSKNMTKEHVIILASAIKRIWDLATGSQTPPFPPVTP